jgi:hypothetical protein
MFRDEEVVGSNPATPTVEQQVRGPFREIGRALFHAKSVKSPSWLPAISHERVRIVTL